jgi:hypothetical protein
LLFAHATLTFDILVPPTEATAAAASSSSVVAANDSDDDDEVTAPSSYEHFRRLMVVPSGALQESLGFMTSMVAEARASEEKARSK